MYTLLTSGAHSFPWFFIFDFCPMCICVRGATDMMRRCNAQEAINRCTTCSVNQRAFYPLRRDKTKDEGKHTTRRTCMTTSQTLPRECRRAIASWYTGKTGQTCGDVEQGAALFAQKVACISRRRRLTSQCFILSSSAYDVCIKL